MSLTKSMDQVFMNKLTDIIEKNLDNEQFGVKELCLELGVSRSKLYRKLKSINGNSCTEFIREYRLKKAMLLLQKETATSAEISYLVGFHSPSYFSTCFHKYYGYPPSEVKLRFQPSSDNEHSIESDSTNSKVEKKISLKKPILASAFGFILLCSLFYLYFNNTNTKQDQSGLISANKQQSIAILPCTTLNADKTSQYHGDGLMSSIQNHLSKIASLSVKSQTTMENYRGTKKPVKEIGKELDVTYILSGVFQKEKDSVKIIIQLINAEKDELVWSGNFQRKYANIFQIQSDIAKKVAHQLKITLSPVEIEEIEKTPTPNIEAYELLIRSRQTIGEEKIRLLTDAIRIDSNFAMAYADMGAWWLWHAGGWKGSYNSQQVMSNAIPMLTKALELDPNIAEAHYGMGALYLWYLWNFEEAEKEFRTSLKLNPNNAEVIHDFTDLLNAAGNHEEALKISRKGVSVDPNTYWEKSLRLYFSNLHDEAISVSRVDLAIKPNPDRYTELARVHLYLGNYEKVKTLIGMYFTEFPNLRAPRPLATLSIALLKLKDLDGARSFLEEIKEISTRTSAGSPCFYLAMIYAQMGEIDLAFKWLQGAYENHEVEMYWLKVEPPFKPLYNDKRWQMYLKKVGIP